jgi:methylated-DNA-[protein]-cysteine S-methyltransferase
LELIADGLTNRLTDTFTAAMVLADGSRENSELDASSRTVETSIGVVGVVASRDGLRRVGLPGRVAARETTGSPEAAENAREAVTQLEEYLAGARRSFELALDWSSVEERHRRVLEVLRESAPFGHTVTYGELGRLAGEDDPREIGVMMATNPLPLVVPCHRVVASDGLGGYGGGIELKRRLLELENVLPPRLPLDSG